MWTPARLSPAFWGSADSATVDGSGNLTAWPSLSGAVSGTPSTSKPIVVTLDGRKWVRFASASGQYVTVDALAALLTGNDQPFTVAFTAKPSSVAANAVVFSVSSSSSNNPFHELMVVSVPGWDSQRQDDTGAAATARFGGTPSTSAAQVVRFVFTGTAITIVVNGVAVVSALSHDCGPLTVDRATIGCLRRTTNALAFGGDLRQIVIASRAVTAAEGALIDAYLADDAGITLA